MVTDACSLPSLVQRFGRCNRFGETKAQVYVVHNQARISEEIKAGLKFLAGLGGDVSCLSLWNHRKGLSALVPETIAIQSLPAHILDILSMTSLRHGIDVSVYLRGRGEDSSYVEIAWRKEANLLAEMSDSDFGAYMKHMRVLSFEKLNETIQRTAEIVEQIIRNQGDATAVVIQQDGTRLVASLTELPALDLRDCLLILPTDRGGLSGGMLAVENSDGTDLDVAELSHKHHSPRVRHIGAVNELPEIRPGWEVAFETEIGDAYIAVLKEKNRRSSSSHVLLCDHNQAVGVTAKKFAEFAGLDLETANAMQYAGQHHDDGKANPIWQFAAKGGSVEKPLAKTSRLDARRLAGYRHEFASSTSIVSEPDLVRHLVGSHHAGARPTWCGNQRLSPINQNPDAVFERLLLFARMQAKYGWWGLAYLEAILRAADAYVSADET